MTKIFKFGGASVKDANGIINLVKILNLHKNESLVVVVSAMGKTTNALEEIVHAYVHGMGDAYALLESTKQYHLGIMNELFEADAPVFDIIENLFVEIEWVIEETLNAEFDYIYDQIVSIGELVSTTIVAHYISASELKCEWIDARGLIHTDNTYREGTVNWEATKEAIQNQLANKIKDRIIVTQGFIGGTTENFTTTLGREGSDYSAAIFATCLNAESLTIWKDVPGLMNADPKQFPDAQKYEVLPYAEAIEMAYFGATVIHPKTMQPLQKAEIPLYVKSFLEPTLPGTCIMNMDTFPTPIPAIIIKKNQIVISIQDRGYSFVTEDYLSHIFKTMAEHRVSINMMQNSALSFSICVDNNERSLRFISDIQAKYKLKYNDKLELITIRHFNNELIEQFTSERTLIMEQRSRTTVQLVVR